MDLSCGSCHSSCEQCGYLTLAINIHHALDNLQKEEDWANIQGPLFNIEVKFFYEHDPAVNLPVTLKGPFFQISNHALKGGVRLDETEFRLLILFASYKHDFPNNDKMTSHFSQGELFELFDYNDPDCPFRVPTPEPFVEVEFVPLSPGNIDDPHFTQAPPTPPSPLIHL